LIRTWALADKLGDPTSANLFMDHFIDYSDLNGIIPEPESCGLAYEVSTEGSCIRQLVVDLHVYERRNRPFKNPAHYGKDFATIAFDILAEDAKAKAKYQGKAIKEVYQVVFASKHRCRYHQHDADHPIRGTDCEKETTK
jgi:hypothetical protein